MADDDSVRWLTSADGSEATLSDYAGVVVRRKWAVVAAILVCAVVAVGLTAVQTPIYYASSQVLVQPRGQDGLFENQVANLNARAIDTEIKVIEVEAVRSRVEHTLGLDSPPHRPMRRPSDKPT